MISNPKSQISNSDKGMISNLKSQISNFKFQISNLKSQISNSDKAKISDLKSQISHLKSQISNLKSQISNLKFQISNFGPGNGKRGALLVLFLFAAAAYGEVFPRSVRGLLIDTMPPIFVLAAFLAGEQLAGNGSDRIKAASATWTRRMALVVGTLVLLICAVRTVGPRFFSVDAASGLRFRANTELDFDRGRGIYLPKARAQQVNATVEFIRSHVGEGGYFFAHSLDATSYYFLSERNSPTGATLWNDTGTNDAERARTMTALREKEVRLVLTSKQAMAAERYAPLIDYLRNDFHESAVIGGTILLERDY